jgi:hypothetical protein
MLFIGFTFGDKEYSVFNSYIYDVVNYALIFFLVTLTIKKPKEIFILLNYLYISSILMALIGIGQFFTGDPSWGLWFPQRYAEHVEGAAGQITSVGAGWRVFSTASNPNAFGSVIAMAFPLSIYKLANTNNKIIRLLHIITLIIFFIAILISGSRTSLIASGIAIVFFVLYNYAKLNFNKIFKFSFSILLPLGLAFFIFYNISSGSIIQKIFVTRFETINKVDKLEQELEEGRMYKWEHSLTEGFEAKYLLFGRGLHKGEQGPSPHNNYIAVFFITGLWGLIFFLTLLIRAITKTFKFQNRLLGSIFFMMLISFCITSLAYPYIIHKGPPNFFWSIIGLIAVIPKLYKYYQIKDNEELQNSSSHTNS